MPDVRILDGRKHFRHSFDNIRTIHVSTHKINNPGAPTRPHLRYLHAYFIIYVLANDYYHFMGIILSWRKTPPTRFIDL